MSPNKDRRPFRDLMLFEQIQRAQAIAAARVRLGLEDAATVDTDALVLDSQVEQLVGHSGPDLESRHVGKSGITDRTNYEHWLDSLNGAYALGIAVGQLLSPAVFTKGRAR
jgi:hypothetical protein